MCRETKGKPAPTLKHKDITVSKCRFKSQQENNYKNQNKRNAMNANG